MATLKAKEVFCIIYAISLFISGILLIGFSSVWCYKLFYHFKFVPTGSIGPFIVLFLLGFAHLFLTWLAVKGPTREHDCYIILFMVITLGLLVSECAVGVWTMILRDEADVEALLLMKKSFELLDNEFNKNYEWTTLQITLKCCGLTGTADYEGAKGSIPISCYPGQVVSNATFTEGCKDPLTNYVKAILRNGAIISFVTCVFQALGLFTFYTYFKTLRQERSERAARRLAIQKEVAEISKSQTRAGSALSSANASTAPSTAPASAPPPQPDEKNSRPTSGAMRNSKTPITTPT